MAKKDGSWLGLGLVLLAAALWSTSSMFITWVMRSTGITALGLAFWRVLISGLILAASMLVASPRMLLVERRDWPWLAGMGMLAVGPLQVFWMRSVVLNGASVSTVMQCTAPIIVAILAWVFWREPLTWHKWVAIALALGGAALIAGLAGAGAAGNIHMTPLGLVTVLAVAVAYAGVTLFAKQLTGRYSPWTIWTYAFLFAALVLAPFQIGAAQPAHLGRVAIGSFAGLILITTIAGYGIYTVGLGRMQASVASIVAMFEAPCASFWGYAVLGERLNGLQVIGAVLVLGGSILLPARFRDEPAPAQPVHGLAARSEAQRT